MSEVPCKAEALGLLLLLLNTKINVELYLHVTFSSSFLLWY